MYPQDQEAHVAATSAAQHMIAIQFSAGTCYQGSIKSSRQYALRRGPQASLFGDCAHHGGTPSSTSTANLAKEANDALTALQAVTVASPPPASAVIFLDPPLRQPGGAHSTQVILIVRLTRTEATPSTSNTCWRHGSWRQRASSRREPRTARRAVGSPRHNVPRDFTSQHTQSQDT